MALTESLPVVAGHFGTYRIQNPESIYYQGELFSVEAAAHPGIIKFFAINMPPYINMFPRTSLSMTTNSFDVSGPWFSVAFETAVKLNYSLIGDYPRSDDRSEMWSEILLFRPDVVLCPFISNSGTLLEALEMGLAELSKAVAVVEMDHILSTKKYHQTSLVAMMTPFDRSSLIFMLTALFFVSFYGFRFLKKSFNFHDSIWHFLTYLINCPEITSKFSIWRFIGITWLIGVLILQQLFGGDMFTAMAMPPALNVVHTWLDLALSNATILVFDSTENKPDNYLPKDMTERASLTKRIKQIPYEYSYDKATIAEILKVVSKGEAAFLGALHVLQQYNQMFEGKFSDKLYISEDYGQYMPIFLPVNPFAESKVSKTFNWM